MEFNPSQGDVKKIQGKEDIYRLRLRDYRVYFRLWPQTRSIDILLIDIRSGIKDKTVGRL